MLLCALGGACRVGKAEKAGSVLSEEAYLGLPKAVPRVELRVSPSFTRVVSRPL